MSAHAAGTERAALGLVPPGLSDRVRDLLGAFGSGLPITLAVAGILCAISFVAGGGLSLGSATGTEIALTVGGGAILAVSALAAPATIRRHGSVAVGLMSALAALTALSVVWSVQPDVSWQEASRTLAYTAVFAVAAGLARVAPARWPQILAGVALAGVIVSGYALLTKVFPAQINPGETYARLREPYGYWNAIGLTAALAVPACLWLGSRRSGHAALNALAFPALGLLLVPLMLAFSRGALLALAIGLAVWFTAVPLRLRGAAVLLTSAAGAAVVVLWAFSQRPLTKDRIALADRSTAGHQLGVLLLAMVVVLLLAGLAIGFARSAQAPSARTRRQIGATLLAVLALVPVALVGALAASHRGLGGSISHAWDSLTNPHAKVPANDPSRLTAIGSVRARYWNEALKVFRANPALGAGAGGYATARLRYREDDMLVVQHAHGYIVQTLADLGIVGLAVSLALLAAWLASAARSARPWDLRWLRSGRRLRLIRAHQPYTPERIGLLTMLALVVVFGVHSIIDWTWFVPGNACVALLCAGWLAGRGPLTEAALARPDPPRAAPAAPLYARLRAIAPGRAGFAAIVLALALIAAWAEWQPLRSVNAANDAFAAIDRHQPQVASADARTAVARDPLSVYPLDTLAAIQLAAGQRNEARATLRHAVTLQPANPDTWLALARFDLNDPPTALPELGAALYLDPQSVQAQSDYVLELRKQNPATRVTAVAPSTPTNNPGPVGPTG